LFLGYTENEANLAGRESTLTPLGQRQQYLVGNELRMRYVYDDMLLRETYNLPETRLQSAFDSACISSLQSQMMGMYPGSDLNNLNVWQQGNAVPPIADIDWTLWQAYLGD
jgi:hypothetical protein